jgi:hypothetical protein
VDSGTPTLLDFFWLFFSNEIINTLVQNTNDYALSKVARLLSRHWALIDKHELSI